MEVLTTPTLSANDAATVAGDVNFKQGHPVPIVLVEVDDSGKRCFNLDTAALESILLKPNLHDKCVALISVAGAFRKGKSFLLNFFLRYLYSRAAFKERRAADAAGETTDESSCSVEDVVESDWLGDPFEPLTGFSWRGGSERETTGILLWSEPFIVRRPSGEDVAVLLMDTQGAFDSESTVRDCATVFALSTMLSSVQVFNLTQNIQEDDLQHLQLFTEYGRLALEEERHAKPFQSLLFLVRDWSYPYEYSYGSEGGEKVLKVRLEVREKQHEELQQLRRHIRDCFENISCFLMPHPGLSVATNPRFDGRLQEVEIAFREQMRHLVPQLLSSENLVVKRINGEVINARDLMEYVKAYVNIYKGDELPEPKSMLLATAEANNLSAVNAAKDVYTNAMEEVCGGDTPYLAPNDLEITHDKALQQALLHFETIRKMGGPDYSATYAVRLREECVNMLEHYRNMNQAKNVFVGARTPAVLSVVMMMAYFMSGVLDFIGLDPVAGVLNWIIWVMLIGLGTWCYVRYSGQYREVGGFIDTVADALWDQALSPLYVILTQKAAEAATRHTVNSVMPPGHRMDSAWPGQRATSRISQSISARSSVSHSCNPTSGGLSHTIPHIRQKLE